MSQSDTPRLSMTVAWDNAPLAVPIIRDIGKARPTIAPKLLRNIGRLQEEFAEIRSQDPRIVAKLTKLLRAKYTYHTNSIEGNTLTYSETRAFIETGMTISGKPLKDFIEAKNIPQALDMLINMAGRIKPLLRTSDILDLHRLAVNGIEEANPGYFRRGLVGIGDSPYIPPPAYEIETLINEMIEYVNKNPDKLSPLELAFKLHLWCVSIHPFTDGNGRVSRLLAGLVLMKYNLPPTIVKTEHKRRYTKVLRQTQDKNSLKPYYDFMVEEYIATLTEYISAARQAGPGDDLVPLSVAAEKYKIDPEYLSLLARKGTITAMKNGKRWMIRVKDIEKYVEVKNRSQLLLPLRTTPQRRRRQQKRQHR